MNLISSSRFFTQVVDTVGDGTGSQDQNVNGSGTPVEFRVLPPPGKMYGIAGIEIGIRSASAIDSMLEYGDVTALTTGVTIESHEVGGSTIKSFAVLKDNFDLFFIGGKASAAGNNNDPNAIIVKADFQETFNLPLRIDSRENEELLVTINDDLTGLLSHTMLVHGQLFDV